MAVAPAQAAARMSWTHTSLAELAIEDMLEAWDWAGQGGFVPHHDEPAVGAAATTAPRSRLPRTSSLMQLAVGPGAVAQPGQRDARSRAPSSSSSNASPVEALDPGFDSFHRAPTPSGMPALPPSSPPPHHELPTSTSSDLVSLDDIFGAATGRSSPFPTLSSTTHLPTSAPPRPSGLLKNVRALAERLDANLPPAPVLAASLPPPSHVHPPAPRPRPSVAPSSASIASGSTGSDSFSGGSGSSTSTARAENRPLAMYPRPPPAPRGAQQYPRPPPSPKEKKGRKAVQGGAARGLGEEDEEGPASAARKEGAKGWRSGLSVRGGSSLR
ncbi:hypothetical protein JCM3775_000757 [Rhodotorula graminis]